MYKHILVAIENSDADATILRHVRGLAQLTGAELVLVHVADGFAARHFDDLKLRESEEMRADREYLTTLEATLKSEGFAVRCELAMGDPATELIRRPRASTCWPWRRTDTASWSTWSRAPPSTASATS